MSITHRIEFRYVVHILGIPAQRINSIQAFLPAIHEKVLWMSHRQCSIQWARKKETQEFLVMAIRVHYFRLSFLVIIAFFSNEKTTTTHAFSGLFFVYYVSACVVPLIFLFDFLLFPRNKYTHIASKWFSIWAFGFAAAKREKKYIKWTFLSNRRLLLVQASEGETQRPERDKKKINSNQPEYTNKANGMT